MRKGSVYLMLAAAIAAAVFSWLGEQALGLTYALALLGTAGFHYAYACRRCDNMHCAINARSPEFFLRLKPIPIDEKPAARKAADEYADLDARIAGLPLVAVILLGLYGTWLYSPLAAAGVFALIGVGFAGYSKASCTGCGNRCPGNRNRRYKEWKRLQ